ncbi:hypothetical protein ACFYKT_17495 [Cytobacillus sp. FJAT-53684]|uniref:Uncharacterized protein n=1 Tax=Cytobacillus mangrovibacter TaxID=3299024 RepID=A0ABW6K1T7_9BACI
METKLLRIAEIAKSQPEAKFTSLAHLLNQESLTKCHHDLPNKKATGILRTTKEQYGENLGENIENLVNRLRSKSYRLTVCSGVGNDADLALAFKCLGE